MDDLCKKRCYTNENTECVADSSCAEGEECINGLCGVRCDISQTCINGYCESPCIEGEECVNNNCKKSLKAVYKRFRGIP